MRITSPPRITFIGLEGTKAVLISPMWASVNKLTFWIISARSALALDTLYSTVNFIFSASNVYLVASASSTDTISCFSAAAYLSTVITTSIFSVSSLAIINLGCFSLSIICIFATSTLASSSLFSPFLSLYTDYFISVTFISKIILYKESCSKKDLGVTWQTLLNSSLNYKAVFSTLLWILLNISQSLGS